MRKCYHRSLSSILAVAAAAVMTISLSSSARATQPRNVSHRAASSLANDETVSSRYDSAPPPRRRGADEDKENSRDDGNEALVVCGVDGTVYTLDAWTGHLRGLFVSGPALVGSSAAHDDVDFDHGSSDDNDSFDSSGDSSPHDSDDGDTHAHGDDDPFSVSGHEGQATFSARQRRTPRHFTAHDDDDESTSATNFALQPFLSTSAAARERIVPGLDGSLYSLTSSSTHDGDNSNIKLEMLPITIEDVTNLPVTTCRPTQQQQECGVVMGQRSIKLFALDPNTGKIQWVQNSGGPNGGFTASTLVNLAKKKRSTTLLLQREDFSVRNVNMENGEEFWSVSLGKFAALDFGTDGRQKQTSSRTAGAGAGSGRRLPPLPHSVTGGAGDRRRTQRLPFPSTDDDNNDDDAIRFAPFPSISFGKDGNTLFGLDRATGQVLWTRRIGSVVASVYGAGRQNGWVPLHVVDEADILLQPDSNASAGVSTSSNAGELSLVLHTPTTTTERTAIELSPTGDASFNASLVLYHKPFFDLSATNLLLSDKGYEVAKLGTHLSTLFVASTAYTATLDSKGGGKEVNDGMLNIAGTTLYDPVGIVGCSLKPVYQDVNVRMQSNTPDIYFADSTRDMSATSYRTEYGLFLSWQMVSLLVVFLISIAIFGRIIYLRQKRKWILQSSPLLVAANYNNTRPLPTQLLVSGGALPVYASERSMNEPQFSSDTTTSCQSTSFTAFSHARSMSLPQLSVLIKGGGLGVASLSACFSRKGNIGGNEHCKSVERDVGERGIANSDPPMLRGTSNSKSPTDSGTDPHIERILHTKSVGVLPLVNEEEKQSVIERVSNIDGIPLVRYSRYRSEFTEATALGKGGFGTVFRCTNNLDSREYAVKKVWIKLFADFNGRMTKQFSQKLHRVLREVKILALLDHPNIVRYYTAWLELEDDLDDESGMSSVATDTKHPRGFSSELLAGTLGTSDVVSNNILMNYRTTADFSPLTKKKRNEDTRKTNAFGQNNSMAIDISNGRKSPTFTSDTSLSHTRRGSDTRLYNDFRNNLSSVVSDEDLGFNWERSGGSGALNQSFASKRLKDNLPTIDDSSLNNASCVSSSDSSASWSVEGKSETESRRNKALFHVKPPTRRRTENLLKMAPASQIDYVLPKVLPMRSQKHILYIQMQLCSQKTVWDFLDNRQARRGSLFHANNKEDSSNNADSVDIPLALCMFGQIARGVKHVHQQGLIHRDLKPSNCFIDDTGVVKIGDFGLSRESSVPVLGTDLGEEELEGEEKKNEPRHHHDNWLGHGQDNTAGVGTRSYASPEQMKGSDYGASTDVYSLGIILFELCYPMYTTMERYKVFKGVRRGCFPVQWLSTVAKSFPSLHRLLKEMLSVDPSKRPSSAAVANQIDSLLSEYTVLSLDRTQRHEGSIFLRVEAKDNDGVLPRTVRLIKEAAPDITILQYGLRGQESKAIMEFALALPSSTDVGTSVTMMIGSIVAKLQTCREITVVRQVTEKCMSRNTSSLDASSSNSG